MKLKSVNQKQNVPIKLVLQGFFKSRIPKLRKIHNSKVPYGPLHNKGTHSKFSLRESSVLVNANHKNENFIINITIAKLYFYKYVYLHSVKFFVCRPQNVSHFINQRHDTASRQ